MIAALHPTFGFVETDAAVGWLRPVKDVFSNGAEWQSKRAPVVGMPVFFELVLKERVEGCRVSAEKGAWNSHVPSRGRTRSPRRHRGPGGGGLPHGSVGQQVKFALKELLRQ